LLQISSRFIKGIDVRELYSSDYKYLLLTCSLLTDPEFQFSINASCQKCGVQARVPILPQNIEFADITKDVIKKEINKNILEFRVFRMFDVEFLFEIINDLTEINTLINEKLGFEKGLTSSNILLSISLMKDTDSRNKDKNKFIETCLTLLDLPANETQKIIEVENDILEDIKFSKFVCRNVVNDNFCDFENKIYINFDYKDLLIVDEISNII